ncbi:cell division protein SepF [Candidatus Woesearchaeota archaeon]|nr:cell division protein SepF [Candidatus Woesearchaeota archaeon]
MKNFLARLKEKFSGKEYDEMEKEGQEYVELDTGMTEGRNKVVVRPFTLDDFEDVKPVLNSLREGYTIALVNIRPLKERDMVELKRAINKLKKTCDAVDGEIAGFGEDYIVVTPQFATIYRTKQMKEVKGEPEDEGKEE